MTYNNKPCRYCGNNSAGGICLDCIKHIKLGVCVWDRLKRRWREPEETTSRTTYNQGIKMIQWWRGDTLLSEKPAPEKEYRC